MHVSMSQIAFLKGFTSLLSLSFSTLFNSKYMLLPAYISTVYRVMMLAWSRVISCLR